MTAARRPRDVARPLCSALGITPETPGSAGIPEGPYTVMARCARHAVALAAAGTADLLPAAFDVVEQGLQDGDEDTQTLLIAGFLENLQTAAVQAASEGGTPDPDVFVTWLGPRSQAAWRELLTAWRGQPSSLAAVVADARERTDPRSMSRTALRETQRRERRTRRRTG